MVQATRAPRLHSTPDMVLAITVLATMMAAAGEGPISKENLFDDPEAMTPGTNVHLENMVVRGKSGNIVRVGDGRHEIFVAPIDPVSIEFLAIGAKIDVRGTLLRSPSASQARLSYAMCRRAAERLSRDRVFVEAWTITSVH